jgi:hypothetical protein
MDTGTRVWVVHCEDPWERTAWVKSVWTDRAAADAAVAGCRLYGYVSEVIVDHPNGAIAAEDE